MVFIRANVRLLIVRFDKFNIRRGVNKDRKSIPEIRLLISVSIYNYGVYLIFLPEVVCRAERRKGQAGYNDDRLFFFQNLVD